MANPTPNPALGELVARLHSLAEYLSLHDADDSVIAQAADALAAQQREIEGLQKEAWEAVRDLSDKFRASEARAEALEKERDSCGASLRQEVEDRLNAEARANSEGSDASAARKRVRELVAQVAALEQSNTIIGEKVQQAESERDEFQKLAGAADNLAWSMADRAEKAEAEVAAMRAKLDRAAEALGKISDRKCQCSCASFARDVASGVHAELTQES